MDDWLLLIYALPSQPSKKRAYVWRELKKRGALYLRDGVAVLPRLPQVEQGLVEMVRRIEEYDGSVELVLSPQFLENRDASLRRRFREDRAPEYRELHHACTRFLRDVLHEVDANDFGFPDVDKLESELGRLHRWQEQIVERDYFGAPEASRVQEILDKCDRAFEHFATRAADRITTATTVGHEDVFEFLGGGVGEASGEVPL
jgi:hypothetical protein